LKIGFADCSRSSVVLQFAIMPPIVAFELDSYLETGNHISYHVEREGRRPPLLLEDLLEFDTP
jgi:hypothetical protein